MKRLFEGRIKNKQLLSFVAVGVIIGALLLPLVISIPLLAEEFEQAAIEQAAAGGEVLAQEIGRDVHYGDEGIVSGPPAPVTSDNENDYPRYNFESRVIVWVATQQHLYYGSFVLAVPIFVMIIEFIGMVTKDRSMAQKYDAATGRLSANCATWTCSMSAR